MRWIYETQFIPTVHLDLIETVLEGHGNGGNELCGVVNMKTGVKLIFKRPGESNV